MPVSRFRRGFLSSSLLLVALAAGYALWKIEERPSGPPPTPAPVPVEVSTAARRDVPVVLTGIGTVEPFNTVTVQSRVDGQLQQVLFKEGQDIRQGDLLAVIDPRTFEAALQNAQAKLQQDEASLANAQLILNRDVALGKDEFASTQVVDTQRSTVQQLEAQIAQDKAAISNAQTELSYTHITAPIDGRAGLRLVDQGNIVHASDAGGLVVLNQLHPISVISTLPQADVAAIRAALADGSAQAQATSRDDGQVLATGTVELIDNKIDPQSGTLQVKSVFANTDDALWPGQFVEIGVRVRTLPGVVTVPADAVQRGPSGEFVFVVGADKRVSVAPVTVGPIDRGIAVIETGLEAGQTVVVRGQYRLAPGTLVAATPAGNGS
ncbi:efflux RND transporter periplasmic adaptor subunit [Ancylobacter sp. Lp-2]|uniref:efflux RND transporter periplasmic adaptor subunit n=1 Tax=Ancylobacter sp. Lp-2 TaxID=2881339 RepID=UPI001E313F1A|nr:efflux RND transporter periplasmic adaptor subunit [Ancylobacter sp. Lp-2]MCB4768551.1 efflux RND transporter periplasmic adaptor subunit [Ancylobacter sp. Lp-2]